TGLHSTTRRMIRDDLEMAAIGNNGIVRLPDRTMLPASLSRSARELVETGFVTPTEDARLALETINDLTRDAQLRAQEAENLLTVPISPALTAIRSRHPTLRWNPVPGAQQYLVKIAYPPERENGVVVWEASAGVRAQMTLPPGMLQSGQVYLWQVEVHIERGARVSPEARFWGLDVDSVRKVAATERRYGKSALARISVYEAHGLYEEALSQVERLAKMNPTGSRIQATLDRLRRQLGKQ